MRRQLLPALRMILVMTVLTGLAYPLVVTGLAHALFTDEADGSLLRRDGEIVGSSLQGQVFTADRYFHTRPSAAGDVGYDASATSGSNDGPTNETFLALVEQRVAVYRETNGLPDDTHVPVDAVTASGSGLDPEITPANASRQAARVATARGLDADRVRDLIERHTTASTFGILGEERVNVVELNLALDALT
ncbi:MAG TPA: K(+)-transporting ATPase subunit C [Euzebyales bacterium]